MLGFTRRREGWKAAKMACERRSRFSFDRAARAEMPISKAACGDTQPLRDFALFAPSRETLFETAA